MSTIPPARLTRATIVTRGLRKAGNEAITVEANVALNTALFDLYTIYGDWPFLATETPLTLAGSSFALPTDFLRTVDDDALIITAIDGSPTYQLIREVPRDQFDRFRGPGANTGVPQQWTANRATTQGLFYPTPTQAITARLRYQYLPPDIPTDSTGDAQVPLFPWHQYLINVVYQFGLEYERDGRADTQQAKNEMALRTIRQTIRPRRQDSGTLPLDPQVFARSTFDGDV